MSQDRVIIVGAGLAGLAAAERLARSRIPVTIFEGRDRPGGRVWTLRDGFVGKVHAEAGGEFIDEGQDAIRALAGRLGLKLIRVLRDGFGEAHGTPGGRVRTYPAVRWRRFLEKLQPHVEAYERGDHRWDGPIARAIAARSVADFVREVRSSRDPEDALAWLRGLYATDIEDLSLLVMVELAAETGKTPGQQKLYRISGGADRLVERLAAGLKSRLFLGRRVVAVTQSPAGVRIAVQGSDKGLEELSAGHVIMTAPASVVSRIRFRPAIHQEQWRAITRLQYGPATKTHLQFDRAFWRRGDHPKAFGTNLPVGAVWDACESRRTALLTLMAGGSASSATRDFLSKGGPERLIRELSWLRPGRSRLLAARSVTWETDPWARGAYACFVPTYDPAQRLLLARPFGRVLFAGEHTSLQWQGFMNGAVDSGLRAAEEVLASRPGSTGPISWRARRRAAPGS